jgi:hypothetical protein
MNNEYPQGTPFFFLKTNWRISAGLMKDNRSLIRKKIMLMEPFHCHVEVLL